MNHIFLAHSDAALRNRNIVLRYIRENAPVSRTEIWKNIDMSRASVTQIIRQFQESGMIHECFCGVSTGGRKPLYIEFDGKNILFFAFDWISKNLYLMNLNGDILFEETLNVPANVSPSAFAKTIKKTIHAVLDKKLCKMDEITGFALTLPGIIHSAQRRLTLSVELGWKNIDVAALFSDLFGDHVYLERATNLLALAEASNRRKNNNASHVQLFILDRTGIGLSTVIHGKIQHGAHCMHGELGHIKLFSDELCSCGQRGCLEAVIKKLIKENNGVLTNMVLEYFAIGISTAINICDTDVILTGSYAEKMTQDQKKYLRNAILSKITGPDSRNFEIDVLYNSKLAAQRGLCTYMFDCCFPTD